MMRVARLSFFIIVIAAGACSGSFDSGTQLPNGVPPQASVMPMPGASGVSTLALTPSPGASGSPGAQQNAATANYPIADASNGFDCPSTLDGYGCKLQFNLPAATPTPSGATSTPSPTPTPVTLSLSKGASPSPAPAVALDVQALPKNAPSLVSTAKKPPKVTPLMMVALTPSADYALDGRVLASFTLPSSQIDGRGFAVQLFKKIVSHKSTTYRALWTFNKSSRQKNDLFFSLTPPKYTIAKGTTYAIVLYGDTLPASPSPSPTPLSTVSPSATLSP